MAPTTRFTRLKQIIGNSFGAELVEQNIEKALIDAREKATTPSTMFYDPISMFMGREWLVKQHQPIGYADYRQMAKNPIIGSIIQTRINQLAEFAKPQVDSYEPGFVIKNEDGSDPKNDPTNKDLANFIYHCGIAGYGESMLETFVRKFMRDSLTLDQACAEIIPRRNGLPAYMVPVDSATIRKKQAALYMGPNADPNEVLYCQIVNERVVAEYTGPKMMFGIRNPSTELATAGYGTSELELLIRIVTTILNTERYNSGIVSQGGTTKGLLVIKGDSDQTAVESFKRDFRELLHNAADAWRPPVLQVSKDGEVNWITLDRHNRDMEYANLFDFLVKQACGVYQMMPEEINWSMTNATQVGSQFESKITASQRRGLQPLLTFLANQLNVNVIKKIDPTKRLEFVGMGVDRGVESEIAARMVRTSTTVNEYRASRGQPPIKGGDIILNELYLKYLLILDVQDGTIDIMDMMAGGDPTGTAAKLGQGDGQGTGIISRGDFRDLSPDTVGKNKLRSGTGEDKTPGNNG